MITFSNLGNLGRLGNQFFQYAAVRALALEKDLDLALPQPSTKTWHGQDCLLDNFNIPRELFKQSEGIKYAYIERDPFMYYSNFWEIPDNTDLQGFFQSTLYFGNHSETIKKELTPKKDLLDEAKSYVDLIRDNNKPVVSIHLRRGDNADHSNPSQKLNNMYDKNGDYFNYLNKALEIFPDCTYLVFAGGRRSEEGNEEDLDWCKKNLNIEATYSSGSTMQDFCRIMMCDHNILSPVSTFGWWAGYLNSSNKNKVVAPVKYHPDIDGYTHRKGFYPKEFILL